MTAEERAAREHAQRMGSVVGAVKRADEVALIVLALAHPPGTRAAEWGDVPGMHAKRRRYILEKWEAAGLVEAIAWSGRWWHLTECGWLDLHQHMPQEPTDGDVN